jgi:hypothetical protein
MTIVIKVVLKGGMYSAWLDQHRVFDAWVDRRAAAGVTGWLEKSIMELRINDTFFQYAPGWLRVDRICL